MQVRAYVEKKLKEANVVSAKDRLYGNLAVAQILPSSECTADAKRAIDSLIDRLAAKMGTTAAPVAKKAILKKEEHEAPSKTYTESLLKGIDPATGEKMVKIKLLNNDYAWHNPSTRVVQPIPGSNNLPAYI
jgi:hypothetical protein